MSHDGARDPHGEIDELLLRLAGLVRVRSLLERRGASEAELEAHSAEIGRLQWRLARTVQRGLDGTVTSVALPTRRRPLSRSCPRRSPRWERR